ncbi:hypothetical protein [Burkholderia pseudomallei]|uniref:hypothetical protein n=1 Tax=Burkholderia pseudomallei TaxID=28450 RepID=UPI001F2B2F4A|nr:hypothetical protein [Burkholderia pseudomallei]
MSMPLRSAPVATAASIAAVALAAMPCHRILSESTFFKTKKLPESVLIAASP